MKLFITVTAAVFLSTPVVAGQPSNLLTQRVNNAIAVQLTHNPAATDKYGTPHMIKWARQGDIQSLRQAAAYAKDGNFLNIRDSYGNNLFHVAKNADTVQAIASLIRQFYGEKTSKQIATLVNQRNRADETPLHAQINAAHADTFRPLYRYSLLKQRNEEARKQLARLQGNPTLMAQHKAIYCADIYKLASAQGRTLLQAAKDQIPYNPEMILLSQSIERRIPCLAQH